MHLESAWFSSLNEEQQSPWDDVHSKRKHYPNCRKTFSGMDTPGPFVLDKRRFCADRVECGNAPRQGAPSSVFSLFRYHSLSPGIGESKAAEALLSSQDKGTSCFCAKCRESLHLTKTRRPLKPSGYGAGLATGDPSSSSARNYSHLFLDVFKTASGSSRKH